MGMFDSVFVECPDCGAQVEFQSKAGVCELKRYHYKSVPGAIAEDIHGDVETCQCGAQVEIRLTAPVPRVAMRTHVIGSDEEWD